MNGYLVVLRHSMDDLPIKLCATIQEAKRVAQNTSADDGAGSKDVLKLDSSTPIGVDIWIFTNGMLTGCEQVKDFE